MFGSVGIGGGEPFKHSYIYILVICTSVGIFKYIFLEVFAIVALLHFYILKGIVQPIELGAGL
jgi:hypothetical protein